MLVRSGVRVIPRYVRCVDDQVKGRDVFTCCNVSGDKEIFRAVDLCEFIFKPDIQANWSNLLIRLGAVTCGEVIKMMMSSANKQSLC